ncbi:uncharacterized protein si:dkeyp-51f12.3 [Thunnus albacares]|uniref:uncharacterized protein si:dkeyp-51f12.3 n=1 Tax=Thunnus maccoyii TaxID=8240 RepID=UPI001C4D9522|nr:uncharacterized protein si:dkeyp-51f12.3 [Thunnus maccoyii]XP_044217432.1 uncharacterized protein si:dkeyp-51f12.3 [Thunnus albacares]|eukprot:superscaffoldBa00000475_g5001
MPLPRGMLLCLGMLMMTAGGVMALCVGLPSHSAPLFGVGLFLGLGGVGLLVSGLCMTMKNLQVAVPGHFLLHPRTGTRFSPQQALAIQRRLDRIRREMSTDSVSTRPEPEPSLPSTPPPWTMEPPPSYDTVMKSQEHNQQL